MHGAAVARTTAISPQRTAGWLYPFSASDRNTSRLIVALAPFKYSSQPIVATIVLSLSCYAVTANAGATVYGDRQLVDCRQNTPPPPLCRYFVVAVLIQPLLTPCAATDSQVIVTESSFLYLSRNLLLSRTTCYTANLLPTPPQCTQRHFIVMQAIGQFRLDVLSIPAPHWRKEYCSFQLSVWRESVHVLLEVCNQLIQTGVIIIIVACQQLHPNQVKNVRHRSFSF